MQDAHDLVLPSGNAHRLRFGTILVEGERRASLGRYDSGNDVHLHNSNCVDWGPRQQFCQAAIAPVRVRSRCFRNLPTPVAAKR